MYINVHVLFILTSNWGLPRAVNLIAIKPVLLVIPENNNTVTK